MPSTTSPDDPPTPNTQLRRELAQQRDRAAEFNTSNERPAVYGANDMNDGQAWLDPILQSSSATVLGRRPREPSPENAVIVRGPRQHVDLTPMANELLLNKNKRLRSGTTSDLMYFARAREHERSLLQYHATLQVLDTQQELIALSKQWFMPKELKANISRFTISTLLSPSITSYRHLLVPTVLELLEDDGAFDKSFYRNPARIQTISRAIQAAATNHRSSIKKKLIKSIKSKWYIGKLATALTSKTDLKITALILQRLAFIRFQYVNAPADEPDAKGKAFWKHVSKKLAQVSEDASDADGFAMLMKTYLTRDEAAYKVGSKTKIRIYRPDELPAFQTDADKRAKDVVLAAPEDDEDLEDEDGDGDGAGGGDGDGEDDEEAAQ